MADKWHWQESGGAWKGVGIYHVTLVVPTREPLLGRLVIPDNDPMKAEVERTELGKAIVHNLALITQMHPEVRLLQYSLMPDHIHAILYVTQLMPVGIGTVVRGFWQGAKKLGREYVLSVSADNIRNNEQDMDMTDIKRNEQESIEQNEEQRQGYKNYINPIFTEKPFIRVMSRRGQLDTMMRYVRLNPQRLATKRLKPGYFHVQRSIEISDIKYDGVGNAALLMAVRYTPVHVRRWMVEAANNGNKQALRNYMNSCVLAARNGSVMVSPFISPQEKQVMEVLLREKMPIIVLADNGLSDYYKPSDALFDAVADGRVLILSQWKHVPDKKHITREECVALNNMAEEICNKLNCPE